jgi:hypothetical protein
MGLDRKLAICRQVPLINSAAANRTPQAHPVGHMGGPEVRNQGFTGLVLQIFQGGGPDGEGLLLRLRFERTRLITQHPEHHVFHLYFLDPEAILSRFSQKRWCSG